MRIFISYSLGQMDQHIAYLLGQQVQAKGFTVDSTRHGTPWSVILTPVISQAVMAADVVIAIVSKDSQYTSYVQHEVQTAVNLKKPLIALIEKGAASLIRVPGLRYIEFDRHDPGPALANINYTLEGQRNQQNLANWLVAGGLAILALYLLSSEEKS
jgi:hypothetical protein